VVQQLARDQGDAFPITSTTLRKRLKEKGWLASTDTERGKLTVRRTFQGQRRDVLHLRLPAPSSDTGPIGPDEPPTKENGPKSWAGDWAENGSERGEPAQEPARKSRGKPCVSESLGRLGRCGEGERRNGRIEDSEVIQ
jgi:hypothetical protein